MYMHKSLAAMLLGMALSVGSAAATETETEAPLECKMAEVNPVTGHVFCIDPLGAAVEAPPENMKPKCEKDSRGQWSWAPNCDPAPKGAEG